MGSEMYYCPKCGSTSVSWYGTKEVFVVENWSPTGFAGHEMGDFGGKVKTDEIECLTCGHHDKNAHGWTRTPTERQQDELYDMRIGDGSGRGRMGDNGCDLAKNSLLYVN